LRGWEGGRRSSRKMNRVRPRLLDLAEAKIRKREKNAGSLVIKKIDFKRGHRI